MAIKQIPYRLVFRSLRFLKRTETNIQSSPYFMISRLHAVSGFAILAVAFACDAATVSSSVLYVTRTRTIAIQTSGGQFLKWVAFAKANSYSSILAHTGPTLHPFAGIFQLTSGTAVFETSGLVPGQSYTLWRSATLGVWESVYTFAAPSNVHRHQETLSASRMFFRLEKNE